MGQALSAFRQAEGRIDTNDVRVQGNGLGRYLFVGVQWFGLDIEMLVEEAESCGPPGTTC